MRRLVGTVFVLCLLGGPAFATCPSSLQLKDNAGITAPGKYTDDGAGNCMANTATQDGADIAQGTKADAAYGGSGSSTVIALLKGLYAAVTGPISPGTNIIGGVFGSPNVTPADCSIALSAGGTAQNIIAAAATIHGFTLANGDITTGGGEVMWMSLTGVASPNTIGSYPLASPASPSYSNLSSFTTPFGFGINHAVSVVAATSGHKISCTDW